MFQDCKCFCFVHGRRYSTKSCKRCVVSLATKSASHLLEHFLCWRDVSNQPNQWLIMGAFNLRANYNWWSCMKRKLDINAKSQRTTRRATLTTGGHSWVGSMYWCIHHWPLPCSCGHRMCYAPGAWLSGMQYRTRLRLSTVLNVLQLLISPVSDCNESLPSHTAYSKILTSAVNHILFFTY